MNLHNIVSPVLNAVQQTETVFVFKCLGVTNHYGDIVPDYSAAIITQARWQIDSDEALEHADAVNQNMILRKVYIDTTADSRISELNRVAGTGSAVACESSEEFTSETACFQKYKDGFLNKNLTGKGADYIYRQSDNTWWMVNATYDEFAAQGWVCVRAVLQLTKPAEIPI